MSELYIASGFIEQLKSLGFRIEDVQDPVYVRKRSYNEKDIILL